MSRVIFVAFLQHICRSLENLASMRDIYRLGRVVGGFLVVVHIKILAKKRASYTAALEIMILTIIG